MQVLDEPVSAMSEEMAAIAFAMLQERKVNYVTISQSDALMRCKFTSTLVLPM